MILNIRIATLNGGWRGAFVVLHVFHKAVLTKAYGEDFWPTRDLGPILFIKVLFPFNSKWKAMFKLLILEFVGPLAKTC